jgi:nucleotide-binding universal stress UspA family protein
METGRPVIVVPPTEVEWNSLAPLGTKIAIAWADSPEGARAIAFSIPFLQEASHVKIINYGDAQSEGAGARELRDYLSWYGIDATISDHESISSEKASIGANLLEQASNFGADLLIMGAFTHSRLRQIIFGGITRHVLENAHIPLLLAH